MHINFKPTATFSPGQTAFRPYVHLIAVVILTIITLWLWLADPHAESDSQVTVPASPVAMEPGAAETAVQAGENHLAINETLSEATEDASVAATVIAEPQIKEKKVVIRQNDTLSTLFDHYGFGQTALNHLLSADESLLALETLQPGHVLFFRYKSDTQFLEEVELYVHAGYRVVYQRIADDAFKYETRQEEGEWISETVSGEISGSFYLSAQRAGLTEAETATVTNIFKEQLDFARVIRKGDQFQVVRNKQFIDGVATGETHIHSARIQRRAFEHTAFLFQDGRYYDKQGNSLARAFTRTPLAKSFRISSHFNPRRVHPVTGRVSPHNGVDFATPTGTKVLSTGDGVVTRVGNHRYAGRYVDVKHGGRYKTRYLHLHRVLVRKGESVTRGQVIALSGNTGRSTGPHLHFELHVNGRPVNPLKADIPLTRSISKKDKADFLQLVTAQTELLDTAFQIAKPSEARSKEGSIALSTSH